MGQSRYFIGQSIYFKGQSNYFMGQSPFVVLQNYQSLSLTVKRITLKIKFGFKVTPY
jgi:hypothetical protein